MMAKEPRIIARRALRVAQNPNHDLYLFTLTGEELKAWLTREEERHRTLMTEAGFVASR